MMTEGAKAGLKAVHKWGVGYDNIDIETAREAGVRVLRTTGSNAVPVAETAVALMLALQRSIVAGHTDMQEGKWSKWEVGPRTYMLTGKTVGLIGLGHIGKNVARMLQGFGCRLLYYKPRPLSQDEARALGVTHTPLDRLLAEADVVSLHCNLTPETSSLIDAGSLAAMKDGALLINTARGGIVDENAVADAIESGRLRGAAFDVFEIEPTPPDHRLIGLPGVIVTPHIASQAVDNFAGAVTRMIDNLAMLADGQEPPEGDVVV
jgi:phosphoglycerate dehydrogenase-like enzyme